MTLASVLPPFVHIHDCRFKCPLVINNFKNNFFHFIAFKNKQTWTFHSNSNGPHGLLNHFEQRKLPGDFFIVYCVDISWDI